MLEIVAVLCLLGGLVLLGILSWIDLRDGLLPNELLMGLTAFGLVFHLALVFHYFGMVDMALGAVIGGGILYLIRSVANYFYQEDALGLGDVKLLAAGGIWLGPEGILIGMTVGAFAGFLHGLAVALLAGKRAGVRPDYSKFSIPAGPGFAFGLILAAIYEFRDLPRMFL